VILSNPPWERIKLQEKEFFAARDARIALAANKAARARLINDLPRTNPELHGQFVEALRAAAAAGSFMRHGGRFPLTGRGDINTYAVFAELCRELSNSRGRSGVVLPSGIAFADTTKYFFEDIVLKRSLVSLFSFFEIRKVFIATDSRDPFCLLTLRGDQHSSNGAAVFAFNAHTIEDIRKPEKRFTLTPKDISLLNPNTRTCPIFQSGRDAELTKAIYRRVPALWREAAEGQPESNPWKISFKALFHMANDSYHFRPAKKLESEGYRLEGNIFTGPDGRYLPLYEAKMLHQYDHRWATYETADEVRDVTPGEKRAPNFVVQPRYWVAEDVVDSAIPKYPEPLEAALQVGHRPSIQCVLSRWLAGYFLSRGQEAAGDKLLLLANVYRLDRSVQRAFGSLDPPSQALALQRDFPLDEKDVSAIADQMGRPEEPARELVARFSPKWLIGWRDICRSTDERTLIASVMPATAVGHKFQLIFSRLVPTVRLCLVALLDSFVVDYCTRQKLGGTSFSYFVIRQLPVLPPSSLELSQVFCGARSVAKWFVPRTLELVYVSNDMAPLANDCDDTGLPFLWDDDRRFEIRCELDAAFFHLYLPAEDNGQWQLAEGETSGQLASLKTHFSTPHDAVGFIMDQFPLVRQKDEQAHGRYRTKERILEIYDAMLAAQRSGQPYQTSLNPPPGEGPRATEV
jgi:hypothetical protein